MTRIEVHGPYRRPRRIAPALRAIYAGAALLLLIVAGIAWFAR